MTSDILTGYPQMPPLTQEELESFLSRPLIAKLGTINKDGTIHLAPVLFLYENGEIILGTQEVSRRVRNIKRNPNVTLLIDDPTPPYKAALIYGTAELEYDNVVQKRTAIFAKNRSLDEASKAAEGLAKKWKPIIIRIRPNRIVSFDYAKASLV